MLPPELVRYIYEFVVPKGMSWRTEHHMNVLDTQSHSVHFKHIKHNYVHELLDRYCILDVTSVRRYVNTAIIYKDNDTYNLKRLCCSVWIIERNAYITHYRKELYKRVWNPHHPVPVLGRYLQCTLSQLAYTRLLRIESMRTHGFMNWEWSGCIPLDVYRTECIERWSI